MPNPNDRHIVRDPDGGWDVKGAHAKRFSKHAKAQAEAIQHAKGVVRNTGGREGRIQGRDGRFPNSDTVATANDPRPSGTQP